MNQLLYQLLYQLVGRSEIFRKNVAISLAIDPITGENRAKQANNQPGTEINQLLKQIVLNSHRFYGKKV